LYDTLDSKLNISMSLFCESNGLCLSTMFNSKLILN
jgi:hypothetical protein